MKKAALYALMGSLALFASAATSASYGATITAYELIQDRDSGDNDVDLRRTRDNNTSVSGSDVENDDSAIKLENFVSSTFGQDTTSDVTYSHNLDWLTHGTLASATLEISARGVLGNNDVVIVLDPSGGSLGNLLSGNSTTTTFLNVIAYLVDDLLQIKIDKNLNASGGALNDKIEIVSSKLTVTWNTASSNRVPDSGATLALLGFGLMGMAACSRKLGSKKN